MTPTLFGRWQTRLLLLLAFGSLISWGFMALYQTPAFFAAIAYIGLFGVVWDLLYQEIQSRRWDQDWPAAFQALAALWEGLFLGLLYPNVPLPGLPQDTPWNVYALHYLVVWCAMFIASQTLMRVLFPRWRFRGGQWL
jgi:hypothetical protein